MILLLRVSPTPYTIAKTDLKDMPENIKLEVEYED